MAGIIVLTAWANQRSSSFNVADHVPQENSPYSSILEPLSDCVYQFYNLDSVVFWSLNSTKAQGTLLDPQ